MRYLWTSIPRVDIDYSRGLNTKQISRRNALKEYKFTEFVYWVLLSKSLDLDSVRLSCSNFYSMSTVGRWIHAAVTRNVKQLDLVFCPRSESGNEDQNIEMPHCPVTCCSVEVLRLFLMGAILSFPNFTGFPSLRVLELNGVQLLDADTVKVFFKSCRLLEDLSLTECVIERLEFLCISCPKLKNLRIDNRKLLESADLYPCSDVQICCPNLVFMELSGTIAHKIIFDSLNSLKKAVIHPYEDNECELFARISHVESLSISLSFAFQCIDLEVDVPVSLPNLKTLELTVDRGLVKDVLQFLKKIPNLESLHLNIMQDHDMATRWKLNEAATVRILTRRLKKVMFAKFYGKKWALDIACFFLEHGEELEEMVFIWRDEAMFKEKSTKTMNQVSKFHKASSNVKLISLLKPFTCNTIFFNEA